jgi:hypothetical protein
MTGQWTNDRAGLVLALDKMLPAGVNRFAVADHLLRTVVRVLDPDDPELVELVAAAIFKPADGTYEQVARRVIEALRQP